MLATEKLRSLEELEGHERLALGPRLRPDEQGEDEHPGDDERPDRDRAPDDAPVVLLALLQTEHDRGRGRGAQEDADHVELVRVRLELGHEDPREHEADDADGDVDEEDPLPAEAVDEQAAGSGPTSVATPAVAPHRPIAAPRRFGGKVRVMTAIVCGVMSAAPRPCTARATISSSSVDDRPQPSEARVKTASPMR